VNLSQSVLLLGNLSILPSQYLNLSSSAIVTVDGSVSLGTSY